MTGRRAISVFGSTTEVSEKLNGVYSGSLQILTPLEVLSNEEPAGLWMDKDIDLSRDVCFLIYPVEYQKEIEQIISDAGLDLAKVNVALDGMEVGDSGEQSEESADMNPIPDDDPLAAVQEEIAAKSGIQSLFRVNDTRVRLMNAAETNSGDVPPTVLSTHSILNEFIPQNHVLSTVICQFPTVDEGGPDDAPSLSYDSNLPFIMSSAVCRIKADESNNISPSTEGDLLLVENSGVSYIIESFTPAIITVVTPDDDGRQEVRTWHIYHDGADGMNPDVAKAVIESGEQKLPELDPVYRWPKNIDYPALHVSPPVYSQNDSIEIYEAFKAMTNHSDNDEDED